MTNNLFFYHVELTFDSSLSHGDLTDELFKFLEDINTSTAATISIGGAHEWIEKPKSVLVCALCGASAEVEGSCPVATKQMREREGM